MANIITKRTRLSRRLFLKGLSAAQSTVVLGLPPLVSMFNSHGTAYAASAPIERRFVLWFNGNGIPERYWIPAETGPGFVFTPCLAPLAPFRDDIHVLSGLDNAATRAPGGGNGHTNSRSGLVSGRPFTGRGAG